MRSQQRDDHLKVLDLYIKMQVFTKYPTLVPVLCSSSYIGKTCCRFKPSWTNIMNRINEIYMSIHMQIHSNMECFDLHNRLSFIFKTLIKLTGDLTLNSKELRV